MDSRQTIDRIFEMARYYIGPIKPYDEIHLENAELKYYDRKRGPQKWYFRVNVLYQGRVFEYRNWGDLAKRHTSSIDWEKRRELKQTNQPKAIFSMSSMTLKKWEEKAAKNPDVWKLYTETIKPHLDKSLEDFEKMSGKPTIQPDQFLSGTANRQDDDTWADPERWRRAANPRDFSWLSNDQFRQVLDDEGIRYMQDIAEYGVERYAKYWQMDDWKRVAVFIDKLMKPDDKLFDIRTAQRHHDYVLMNPEEQERFEARIQRLARQNVSGMLS